MKHEKRLYANPLFAPSVPQFIPSDGQKNVVQQRAELKRRIIPAAMTSIESGEQALLRILSSHLEITEKLLFDHIQLAILVRQQMPQVVDNFLELPKLEELRSSTTQLRQRVQSMLG
jgi:hypothetical protein